MRKESVLKLESAKKPSFIDEIGVESGKKKQNRKSTFPIVGIGVSAGSVESLRTLLKALPSKAGMAFVLVHDFHPAHDGLLPSTLSKDIGMPVSEVTGKTSIHPNSAYIIKPNVNVTIASSVLQVVNRGLSTKPSMAIDRFFRTLAHDRGPSAIGILLAGNADDGMDGLEAIHAAGGITFAGTSARSSEMHRLAIESGYVDFVLTPEQIASELMRIKGHAQAGRPGSTVPTTTKLRAVRSAKAARSSADRKSEADRLILDRYSLAGFVANSELQVIHFHRDLGPYLQPAPGTPSLHILKLLRPEIGLEVRDLINESRKGISADRKKRVTFSTDTGIRKVDIIVVPLSQTADEQVSYLVLFDDLTDPKRPAASNPGAAKGPEAQEIERLKEELASSRGYLQSMVFDRDATNDELRAASQEIAFSNEELQRIIEELETTKEELQSSNAEMTSLNEELNSRNLELTGFADDLTNLLNSVSIPILILDLDRHIRRFTPSAMELLNLRSTDIGRPFSDILTNLQIQDLDNLISEVLGTLHVLNLEVQDRSGHWYSLRIRPYRSAENRIEGVVISLFDIDQLKRTIEEVTAAREFAHAVIETVHVPLLVLDQELYVLRANDTFCETFKTTSEEVEGVALAELGDHVWNIPPLLEALSNVLPQKTALEDFAVDRVFPRIGRKSLVLNAKEIQQKRSDTPTILVAIHDVTARKAAEESVQDALLQSESTVTAILRASAQAILGIDSLGRIVFANIAAEEMFGYPLDELSTMTIDNMLPKPSSEKKSAGRDAFLESPPGGSTGHDLNLFGLRKDGSEFPLEVSVTHLQTKKGMLAINLITDISERRSQEETLHTTTKELRQNRKALRALTARLITAREEETQHLARELHDDFGQRIAVLAMELATLAKNIEPTQPAALENLKLAVAEAERLADDLQDISRRLHPSIIDDLGLAAALRSECMSTMDQFRIPIEINAARVPDRLPKDVSLCVYRVVQEALRNMVKHSRATEARVSLSAVQDTLVLMIEDNGVGFNSSQIKGRGGLGLVSMEERARLVGGSCSIRSNPIDGTQVKITIPIERIST